MDYAFYYAYSIMHICILEFIPILLCFESLLLILGLIGIWVCHVLSLFWCILLLIGVMYVVVVVIML